MYYYTPLYSVSSENITASVILSYLSQTKKKITRRYLAKLFCMTERGIYKSLAVLQNNGLINKDLTVNDMNFPDNYRSRYIMIEDSLIRNVGLSCAIYASWAKNRILGKGGRSYHELSDRQASRETTLSRRTIIRNRSKLKQLGILVSGTGDVKTENIFTKHGGAVMVDIEKSKRDATERHAKKYQNKDRISREEIAHVFINACTRTSYDKAPPPTKADTMKVYRIQQNMLKMGSPVKITQLISLMVERWGELQTLKGNKTRTPDLGKFPLYYKELYQMASDKPRREIIIIPISVPNTEDIPDKQEYQKIFS